MPTRRDSSDTYRMGAPLRITAATFGAGGWHLAPMQSTRGGIKEDTIGIADSAVRPRHTASPFPTEPAAASPATQGGKSPLRPSGDSAGSSGLARAGQWAGTDSWWMQSSSETFCRDSSSAASMGDTAQPRVGSVPCWLQPRALWGCCRGLGEGQGGGCAFCHLI